MNQYELHLGDCLDILRTLPDNSVDSVVCDPPYGLSKEPNMAEVLRHWLAGDDYQHNGAGFMGRTWDSFVPGPARWRECLRVIKPGGHLLAFFGSRTHDIGTLAIRLAGFEIRDMGGWLFGSGFPKSHNLDGDWDGWGTALKPAHEPITFARKPLAKGCTVAANVLAHGTGALNIDACRVEHVTVGDGNLALNPHLRTHINGGNGGHVIANEKERRVVTPHQAGRWPANLIHDGSDEVVALFPVTTSGGGPKPGTPRTQQNTYGAPTVSESAAYGSTTGNASRFFYCAKASRKDRNEGLDSSTAPAVAIQATMREREDADWQARNGNHHPTVKPTVKPTDLMAYLCRLVTPPGGVVLDPFMGSGSTGKAAIREGFRFIGCELSAEYMAIAEARIAHELAVQSAAMMPKNDNGGQIDMGEVWGAAQ